MTSRILMRYLFFLAATVTVFSCIPPGQNEIIDIEVDYSLEEHRHIRNLQDKRMGELLVSFLSSKDPTLRYLAADALASVQDSLYAEPLFDLLNNDSSEEIRFRAAYALGQLRHPAIEDRLAEAFQLQDDQTVNTRVRCGILEAVGKTGGIDFLNLLSEVQSYSDTDHWLLLGQARAIYRFGSRGIYSRQGTNKMIEFILNRKLPNPVRKMAACYLNDVHEADISDAGFRLLNSLSDESDPEIRAEIAGAITRLGDPDQLIPLLSRIKTDSDPRVAVAIVSSMGSFPFESYRDSLIPLLSLENSHLPAVVSQLFGENAGILDVSVMLDLARSNFEHIVKANLYSAVLNGAPVSYRNTREIVRTEMVELMNRSISVYEKIPYVKAFGKDPGNYAILLDMATDSDLKALSTHAIGSLERLVNSASFDEQYARPRTRNRILEEIERRLMSILLEDDSGALAATSQFFRSEGAGISDTVLLRLNLRQALRNLDLPAQIETRYEIEQTLAYLDSASYHPAPPRYNHPIEWELIDNLSDSSKVYVLTDRGQFEILLHLSDAPGSVANFVDLVRQGFYNGNIIHRSVPNFVIQAGCNRGDGFGSLAYTVRSELGASYFDRAGMVGMASAGKDTESNQWFITTSPAPHLDGRYTIFGEVISGMEVVRNLKAGDEIREVRVSLN